jgi:hypothetical protein
VTPADALPGDLDQPRDNGELLFDAPWQARAVALAVALVAKLGLPWDEFRTRLIAAIARTAVGPTTRAGPSRSRISSSASNSHRVLFSKQQHRPSADRSEDRRWQTVHE